MDSRRIPKFEYSEHVCAALVEALSEGKFAAVAAINALVMHQSGTSAPEGCAKGYTELFRKTEYRNYIVEQGAFELRVFGTRIIDSAKRPKRGEPPKAPGEIAAELAKLDEYVLAEMARIADEAGIDGDSVRKEISDSNPRKSDGNPRKSDSNPRKSDGNPAKATENATKSPENISFRIPDSVSGSGSGSGSHSDITPNRPDSRPPAPASAPARDAPTRPREAGPDAGTETGTGGATPPRTPQADRGDISSQIPPDADEPFPDEEQPGTPEEHAAVRAVVEKALGGGGSRLFPDRTGKPVEEAWEWQDRDPVEATVSTFGKGMWGAFRATIGTDMFREFASTLWHEMKAGDKIDKPAALLTRRIQNYIRDGGAA